MSRVKRVVLALLTVWRRRGLVYICYLLTGWLIPRLVRYVLYQVPRRMLKIEVFAIGGAGLVGFGLWISLYTDVPTGIAATILMVALCIGIRAALRKAELVVLRREAERLMPQIQSAYAESSFTLWSRLPVDAPTRRAVEDSRRNDPTGELILGHIDTDGRYLGLFGDLPGLPSVSKAEFGQRSRISVEIVLIGDHVLVRKDYRGNEMGFLSEWLGLLILFGKANIPAFHHVDVKGRRLYKNLIVGKTIREVLVDNGARILLAQAKDDPELAGLSRREQLHRIVARGSAVVSRCISSELLQEVNRQMRMIHMEGVSGISLTFGNVVLEFESGHPWLIDLDGVRFSTPGTLLYLIRRDSDRVKFNQRYGRDLLTLESVRAELLDMTSKLPSVYAPIDFGHGLTIGGFWSTDSGTGKWEFLNRRVVSPLIGGKRVLDLGSNNGALPLMMLRAGAREVVGAELSSTFAEAAEVVRRVFEWLDMRDYNFHVHNGNMLDIVHCDWGSFDVVTAFCSLYYLSLEDMARVVRRASELAPVMVLQANVATRREAAEQKSKKSSIPFLKRLLQENGFPHVDVYAPMQYSRPLLVGRQKDEVNVQSGLQQSGSVRVYV